MKNYSYLLALTFGLMQIGTVQAGWGASPYISTELAISKKQSTPTGQFVENAHKALGMQFHQLVQEIDSLFSENEFGANTKYAQEDLINLYRLYVKSINQSIIKAPAPVKEGLKSELNDIKNTYTQTMNRLKSCKAPKKKQLNSKKSAKTVDFKA